MSEPTIQSTISMWGSGDYSLHTKGAKDVIDNASDLVLSALEDMDVDPNDERPLQLADFAAADGGTSIDLMRAMVGKLRGRAPTRPIRVCYTDLPSNDYSALFQLVHGLKPAVKSYMQEFDGVYPFASATSFFERIFPDQQLDFGFSATAMHWLSEMPCDVSDHIHSVGASGRERELIRQRAAHDWEDILACRAKELRSGGRMVMVNLAVDDAGQHMGNTGGVNMFDTMNMLWRRLV
ncbi:MAG: class I SAM-dependent methyltransferase, partial [Gammaproteobacteria bacterium]|nr:class I SAM-dependent methyltransferase [Gammaproteobacteria bacterium]